jgi:MinD-like ATPase involved in chromosome partitioning or flagellar assembly
MKFLSKLHNPLIMQYYFNQLYVIVRQGVMKKAEVNPDLSAYTITMSACYKGEGVTTMVLNAALALSADDDRKTLLVDANLRHPELHSLLNIKQEPGLYETVWKNKENNCVKIQFNGHSLDFIQAGIDNKNQAAFFSSEKFSVWLDAMKQKYNYIFFDTAPLHDAPETYLLAKQTDSLLLIIEAEQTKWQHAFRIKSNLDEYKINCSGAILNKKKHYIPKLIYQFFCS